MNVDLHQIQRLEDILIVLDKRLTKIEQTYVSIENLLARFKTLDDELQCRFRTLNNYIVSRTQR